MKISTKLMTLMGATVLGFSTLVPVIGASAATTPLPADTSGGVNDITGKATGVSDAHVTVEAGYLTLMQVPDFNFGRAFYNQVSQLDPAN
ncbi:hypothetical protein [Loigolactobacillus zhaoyuanensis]|uniref:hypothetical protein n=1 Tax=Loigolactobacillus zhaoyuanensis TaxID=2486017 RepID=UPI000F739D7B|nr:hypothetical protein [Loigolactobacillus zhaoyuanensis]